MPDGTGAVSALSEDGGATRRGVSITTKLKSMAIDILEHEDLRNITTTLKFEASDILEHEDPVGVVSQRSRTIRKEIMEFPEHLKKLWRSNFDVLKTLMPGMKLRRSSTHALPMILACSVLWMSFYFTKLYSDDHEEHRFPEWEEPEDEAVEPQAAPSALDCADIVFVFHRPDSDHSDTSRQVPVAALKEMVLYDKARPTEYEERAGERFCDFKEFLEHGTRHQDNDPESPGPPGSIPRSLRGNAMSAGQRAVSAVNKAKDGVMNAAMGQTAGKIGMTDARVELLQDMFKCLPLMGFDVSIFRSVDNADLFLTISLSRKQWVSYYLAEESSLLQINHSVVEGLGVSQDPDDPNSSPPFVLYNRHIVNDMYRKSVTTTEDDRSLYRTWYDRDPKGSVMSSRQRINIILAELQKCLDLDVAGDIGVLRQWYPAHSEMWLRTLREMWADRWSSLNFVQPIDLLKEYFGSQVAFNFAWQGLYCKGLVALSVVAVVVEMFLKMFPPILADVDLINSRVMLPFSIVLVIWARIMANLWEREEQYFAYQWDMQVGTFSRIERASFRGVLCESDADKNLTDDRMPQGAAARRKLCSLCITLSCCCLVMSIISTWVFMHDGKMDLVSSLTLSLFIKIFELCYNGLSNKLALYENHKYEDSFHDSGVWHQFLFQAVNSYWAVVSIAINQLWSGRCEEHSCLPSLKIQTTMLMLILLSCSIAFATIELVIVRASIVLEKRNLKRRLGNEEAERRTNQRSFLEEQAKYTKFDTKEQIENTLQLVLALGYVLVFGTLQPLVVPLCLVHFAVTLRVRAALLTRYAKRCVPYKLVGIGAWKHAVYILMNAGVFFSALLLVYWGRFFKGGALVAKLTGMIMWLVTASCLWSAVDIFVPTTSSDLRVLKTRRRYVEQILTEISLHRHLDSLVESARTDQSDDVPQRYTTSTSLANQIVRQRSRRLNHTRGLGRTTGDEDIAPDDAKCAQLVESKQWSRIPMLDSGGGRPPATPRMTSGGDPAEEAQGEPGSK
jgi:hypothetical protein